MGKKYFLGEKRREEERVPKGTGVNRYRVHEARAFHSPRAENRPARWRVSGEDRECVQGGLVGRSRVLPRDSMHRGSGAVLKAEGYGDSVFPGHHSVWIQQVIWFFSVFLPALLLKMAYIASFLLFFPSLPMGSLIPLLRLLKTVTPPPLFPPPSSIKYFVYISNFIPLSGLLSTNLQPNPPPLCL